MSNLIAHQDVQVSDPPFVQKLFGSRALAWVWLLPRLYVGYSFFDASTAQDRRPQVGRRPAKPSRASGWAL